MEIIYPVLRWLHIAAGTGVLILFWGPVLARKGGRAHVGIGKVYVVLIAITVVTAIALSALVLVNPLSIRSPGPNASPEQVARFVHTERIFAFFLAYAAGVILVAGGHGLRVLKRKQDRQMLQTPFHIALNVLIILFALVMLFAAFRERALVLGILSPVGLLIGIQNLRYILRPPANRMAWWYEHLRSMIPTGIAAYTAFLVFGARRVTPALYASSYYWVFWALPLVVGVTAVRLTIWHYRRKFGEHNPPAAPAGLAAKSAPG